MPAPSILHSKLDAISDHEGSLVQGFFAHESRQPLASNPPSPPSSRPIHANWLTRPSMTPKSTYATVQPTSLLALGNCSLVPVNLNVHAALVYSIPMQYVVSYPHSYLRFLHKFLSSSSRTDPVRTDEPLDSAVLLQFPATSPLPRPLIKPDENSRLTPAPPTSQSSAINTPATLKSSLRLLSTWWPLHTDHASPTIVDVPSAPGKPYATAGAPGDDDDLIHDEDYVSPPPSPNPGSRPGIVNTGQHGSGRFCFYF
ncbi:hypothetical protein BDR05DRAFT_992872 [Suillus weaverae]|nr:hypothetical protein BDR05DRAFT_992872 [Suillus weaverae]